MIQNRILNSKKMKGVVLIFAFIGVTAIHNVQAQTIRYVQLDGTSDGSSWTSAAGNIQDMIDASSAGDQIWIASGNYGTHGITFYMKDGVHLYGGFAGNETSIDSRAKSDRDGNGKVETWEFTNETILNLNHSIGEVIRLGTLSVEFNIETQLDGFTVTGGSVGIKSYGKTIINNCIIHDNANDNTGSETRGVYILVKEQ